MRGQTSAWSPALAGLCGELLASSAASASEVARSSAGGGEASGEGYGLGVRVVIDPANAGNLTSAGTFGWSGAAGTHFFVDRQKELIAVFMVQRQGPGGFGMSDQFETLYQAIVD
jgi:CubicO group peptidase (beta-lactamase class C family)